MKAPRIYRRLDGACWSQVLAIGPGRVLVAARWYRNQERPAYSVLTPHYFRERYGVEPAVS